MFVFASQVIREPQVEGKTAVEKAGRPGTGRPQPVPFTEDRTDAQRHPETPRARAAGSGAVRQVSSAQTARKFL